MPALARVTDSHSHGGTIITGSLVVTDNGLQVARIGDAITCPIHGAGTIIGGSTVVFADGMGVAVVGSLCSCGAEITTGSTTTNIT